MAAQEATTVEIPEAPAGKRHILCPVPGFPGYVAVSAVMTPADFQRWYEKDTARQKRDGDKRHQHFRLFECGSHLLDWHVEGVERGQLPASDGSDLPAMELVTFGVYVILDLVSKATERPI